MEHRLFQDKYPVFSRTVSKSDTNYQTVDEVLSYFENKIDEHPKARLISRFDHYSHTQSISGEIAENIQDAKHVIFCFGMKLPAPEAMAVRPRSIGVADLGDNFVITFMEAPNPNAQEWISEWVEAL